MAIDGSMLGGACKGGSAVHSFAMHRRGAFHSTFSLALSPTGEKFCGFRPMPFPDRRRHFFNGECEQLFHRQTHRSAELPIGHFCKGEPSRCRNGCGIACRKSDGHIPQMARAIFSAHARNTQTSSTACAQYKWRKRDHAQRRDISADFPTKEAKAVPAAEEMNDAVPAGNFVPHLSCTPTTAGAR